MSSTNFLKINKKDTESAQWISLSDLMTSLMLVFLLIAVSFMIKVEVESQKIKNVAALYSKNKTEIYQDLKNEFKNDLDGWGAILSDDLTIRFNEPDVLFRTGQDILKLKFKRILKDFFPRYIKILTMNKYNSIIKEVRIEGHTSTLWNRLSDTQTAYFKNMALSQSRTRTTLKYVMSLPQLKKNNLWLIKHVTANGLSSSKPILYQNGNENKKASQRVEFRVVTDSEKQINKILEQSNEAS